MSADSPPPSKDLDAGLRFLHVMGMQTKHDVLEASTRVMALLEELVAHGQIDLRSLEARRERIRAREQERSRQQMMVSVAPAIDKYAMTDLPDIDCAARLPLCRGRCCMLSFPLSFQDLDEGVVKWEYSRPYLIRHRPEDGYCVHNRDGACGCYQQRPAICRSYSCKNDKRIWSDFEARIPAPWPNEFAEPAASDVHDGRMDPPTGEPPR